MLTESAGAISRLTPRQLGGVAAGAGVLLVLAAIVLLGAFKAVAPSDVCVVQEGGPLDGRGISEVRQPSGGVSFIGVFNSQRCFPATQRNYVISPDRAHREQGETLDFFETPTSDAVQVRIEPSRSSRRRSASAAPPTRRRARSTRRAARTARTPPRRGSTASARCPRACRRSAAA